MPPLTLILWHVIEASHSYFVEVDCTAAVNAFEEGLAVARNTGVRVLDCVLYAQGAHVALAASDPDKAQRLLDDMASVMNRTRLTDVGNYHYLAAWLELFRGNADSAVEHARAGIGMVERAGAPVPVIATRVGQALALLDRGDLDAAAKQLARARREAAGFGSKQVEGMLLMAAARLAFARREDAEGLDLLRKLFRLCRENGFWNMPYWTPGIMTPLCGKALEAGIEQEFVRELIRKRNLVPADPETAVNWPWPVEVLTLGGFGIVIDGRELQFSGKVQQRPLQLLKAIIAFGGRAVGQAQLADVLWPDADGDLANQTFKTTLHRLRQLIENEKAVQVSDGRVSIDSRHCRVDLTAFEHYEAEADLLWNEGRREKSLALFPKAAALYRGDFLAGDKHLPWTVMARERAKIRYIRITRRWSAMHEEAGRWELAAHCYQRGLDVDGVSEDFYRGLMRCHQRTGRTSEALSVYRLCKASLHTVLGVAPSRETEALYEALKRGK